MGRAARAALALPGRARPPRRAGRSPPQRRVQPRRAAATLMRFPDDDTVSLTSRREQPRRPAAFAPAADSLHGGALRVARGGRRGGARLVGRVVVARGGFGPARRLAGRVHSLPPGNLRCFAVPLHAPTSYAADRRQSGTPTEHFSPCFSRKFPQNIITHFGALWTYVLRDFMEEILVRRVSLCRSRVAALDLWLCERWRAEQDQERCRRVHAAQRLSREPGPSRSRSRSRSPNSCCSSSE